MSGGEGFLAKVKGPALARKPLPLASWRSGAERCLAAGACSEVTTGKREGMSPVGEGRGATAGGRSEEREEKIVPYHLKMGWSETRGSRLDCQELANL